MKILKKFTVLTVATVIGMCVFNACQKDEITSGVLIKKIQKSFDDDFILYENPYSIEEYLSNSEDPDEENLDRQLYEIALRARYLFTETNEALNHFIIKMAIGRANDCIDLRTLREWPTVAAGNLPSEAIAVLDELVEIIEATDLRYTSKNPEAEVTEEYYIPAIFVVNIDNADPNKMPIFSPGVFANKDLPGMEEYEDFIVVWYFDPEIGDFVEGLLSEEMAMAINNPIYIVDNACEEMTNEQKSMVDGDGSNDACGDQSVTEEKRRAYYSSNEYQLNVRYENSGKSEFCVTSRLINEDGVILWLNNSNLWYQIDKVKKKDIGKLLSGWVTFCRPSDVICNDVVPFGCNYVFWNTFERDWAKSKKDLGKATKHGKTIELSGNMKSNSNWYAYNPSSVENNPLELAYVFNNWAKWHDNANGRLRIWRIQS